MVAKARRLSGSIDSGLPLPNLDPTNTLFQLWWSHHCLSVDAMSHNAAEETIELARKAADALYEAAR